MTNSTNSVSIEIVLGRKLLSVVLTSFVPTIILVLVWVVLDKYVAKV